MTDLASARRHMVDGQIRTTDVTDLRVISAMLEVARESFMPPASAALAYLDLDVPVGAGRKLLRPMVMAKLIQAAELEATDRVLDVGCATGYTAAVLAHIVSHVVALEQDTGLAQGARAALSGAAKCRSGERAARRRLGAGRCLRRNRRRRRHRGGAGGALQTAQGRRPAGLRARLGSRQQGHALSSQRRGGGWPAGVRCLGGAAAGLRQNAGFRVLIAPPVPNVA